QTESSDFPVTPSAYDTTYNGLKDVFVTKVSPNGASLSYSTFVGGSDYDYAAAIAVDGSGSAYLTGSTRSSDFPTTLLSYDRTFNGIVDVFVTKLMASGNALAYST